MGKNLFSFKSIIRIVAFVFALLAFLMMFTKQVNVINSQKDVIAKVSFGEALFGDKDTYTKGAVASFLGYLFALLAGAAGLVLLVILPDLLPGEQLEKYVSIAVGALIVICSVLMVLVGPFFRGANDYGKFFVTSAGPVVGLVFGCISGVLFAGVPFVKVSK